MLQSLVLLACPIGMGLMMWFMTKGMTADKQPPTPVATVESLRAEQLRVRAELLRREADDRHTAGSAA